MPIDLHRVLDAAVQAALKEAAAPPPPKKKRLGSGRAVLIGAGLVTAGRVAMRGRGQAMLEALQDRLPVDGVPHGVADDEERPDEFDDPELDDEEPDDYDDEPADDDEGPEDDEPEGDVEDDVHDDVPKARPRARRE